MKKLIILAVVACFAGCSSPTEPPEQVSDIVIPDMYYITDPVIEIVPAD